MGHTTLLQHFASRMQANRHLAHFFVFSQLCMQSLFVLPTFEIAYLQLDILLKMPSLPF